MRLLVTGTGRCGTTWLASTITAAGVPCGHEQAFSARGAVGGWSAEVSWPAAAWLPLPDAHVAHLVRHPLDAIRSRLAVGTFSDRRLRRGEPRLGPWAVRHCPDIARGRSELERCARHWVAWNELVEPHAHERLRLEDITAADVTRLARAVDPTAELAELPPPQRSAGDRLGPPLRWMQVRHVPGLLDMARRYGYLEA